jgi:hypothetical protein
LFRVSSIGRSPSFRLRSSINVLVDAVKHLLNFGVSTTAGPYP